MCVAVAAGWWLLEMSNVMNGKILVDHILSDTIFGMFFVWNGRGVGGDGNEIAKRILVVMYKLRLIRASDLSISIRNRPLKTHFATQRK